MILTCVWMSSAALVIDMLGRLTGMYISVTSLRVGMNSLPMCISG